MELEVSNESDELFVAFFLDVPTSYEPDWNTILGNNAVCFDSFRRLDSAVPTWTFRLTKRGKDKFRGSRKSAVFGVGGSRIYL
jgi:hypothetical protein